MPRRRARSSSARTSVAPASPHQISTRFRLVEPGACRELGQDLRMADIEAVQEIGAEQAFDDALGAALAGGEADQSMRAQGVGSAPDPLERKFNTFVAAREGGPCIG